MGIYVGQLPPAELARLKAELAETIIANFCYPRFFDYRTESLRMRPVDRAKRQEVWLYLSSVDFTTWNRVDVMSPDFQRQLERLFIQFVQRNRSFFGEQGRKRMSDIRMLIGSSATNVTQGLRAHIAGQRPTGVAPFGSPRAVVTWSTKGAQSQSDVSWEKIANATMLLQHQLLEARGSVGTVGMNGNSEIKSPLQNGSRAASPSVEAAATNGTARRVVRPHPDTKESDKGIPLATPPTPIDKPSAPASMRLATTLPDPKTPAASAIPAPVQPAQARSSVNAASMGSQPPTPSLAAQGSKQADTVSSTSTTKPANAPTPTPTVQGKPAVQPATVRPMQQLTPIEQANTAVSPIAKPSTTRDVRTQAQSPMARVAPAAPQATSTAPPVPPPTPPVTPIAATPTRSVAASSPVAATNITPTRERDNPLMRVSDDDIAIFEQLRHQLIVWLRIEVIRAGLDLASQTPSQLLELLRQQNHMDETRLQVVSTLLNLANQVITNGQVSVLDYKQALMFHLMHTRR